MKYVKFLEENMDKIVNKLNFSQVQAEINQAHEEATKNCASKSSRVVGKIKKKNKRKIRR